MLVLWGLQIGTLFLVAWPWIRGLGQSAKIGAVAAALAWTLGTLVFVLASCAVNSGQEFVQTIQDATTGKRLEIYHTDQHDHLGLGLYLGSDGFSLANHRYFRDHFEVKSITKGVLGKVVIQSYFAPDILELDLETGEIWANSAAVRR